MRTALGAPHHMRTNTNCSSSLTKPSTTASGSSMADDDDEELFGDFKFVSSSNSNSNSNSNQQHRTGDYFHDDGGDWGDFVDNLSQKKHDLFPKTSFQFNSSNGFIFATQNPTTGTTTSSSFEASRSFDPFGGVFSDQSMKRRESQSVDSASATAGEKKRWEKAKGALPLSIFGDEEEEEEEESDLANPTVVDDAWNLFSTKPSQSVKNGLNFGDGVGFNDLIVNLYAQAEQIKSEDVSISDPVDGSGDFDEDDWEFKDAFTENAATDRELGVKKDEDMAEITIEAAAVTTAATTTTTATTATNTMDGVIKVNGEIWGDFEQSTTASGFSNTGEFGDDWFVASNSSSYNPDKVVDDFHFESGGATTNGSTSDLFSQFDLMAMDNTSNSYSNDRIDASQEKFSTFELPGQTEETPKLADQSAIKTKDLMFDGESQVNGRGMENHHGELPLPIFGNKSLDSNDSLFVEDVFSYQPSNSVRNGINSQSLSSNISFNELISNLYSQAEHIPAVSATRECSDNGLAQMGSNSDPINGEADFDDWEFQDAFSEARAENQSSVLASGDMLQKFATESATMNLVDFYTKLKEEVYCIALHHLDDLKRAKKTAALSGEDAKAVALQDEIQVAYKKLESVNVVCMKDHPTRNICVTEILEVMKNPKYQVLDSEYHLSKRISLAEKDLMSAIGLFEHAVSMLKILTLGSMEDQFSYISTWSKMISACVQELKHGALIWKQSSEKNVHREILSKPKGQQYIVALGEIYRVVEVLRVSTNLYKPWIFSSLDDPMTIFASLEECDAAWSGSALEEALCSITNALAIAYEGTTEALLESIKSIHDLNATVLQNHVDAMQDPTCRLSLLSLRLFPDMKMVDWNGEQYILKLANLWANCVSLDPPQLPNIQLGS